MPLLKNIHCQISNAKYQICLVVALSFFILVGCVVPTFAQTSEATPETPSNQSPYTNTEQPLPSNIPQSSPTYANMVVYNLIHTFSCFIVGQSVINQPCVDYKMVTNLHGVTEGIPVLSSTNTSNGLLSFMGSAVDSLYSSRPITSNEFISHIGDSFGMVKTAHAQVGGSGNGVLSPVYNLWVVSRNLCYLLMIIIFLSVGLMIMFRQKINPQTVISVQAALPGLVLGLILITFSYFLASTITDFAFIGTDLVGYFFQQAQGSPQTSLLAGLNSENPLTVFPRFADITWNYDFGVGINQIFSNLRKGGPADILIRSAIAFATYQYASQVGGMIATPFGAVGGAIAGFFGPATLFAGLGVGASVASTVGGLALGGAAAAAAYNSPGTVASWAIWVILMIMILVAMIRLLLTLLKNYLSIIFYTVTSPFFFLAASLPGRSGIVNEWIRNMLCLVLSFPAVIAVVYFAYYMLTGASGNALADSAPPFLIPCSGTPCTAPLGITGTQTMPFFGGLNLNLINYLLAFSAIIVTPSIPDIICKAIGKIGPYGQMVEQSLTGSQKEAQGRLRSASQAPGQIAKDLGGAREHFTGGGEMRWDPEIKEFKWVPAPSKFQRTFIKMDH